MLNSPIVSARVAIGSQLRFAANWLSGCAFALVLLAAAADTALAQPAADSGPSPTDQQRLNVPIVRDTWLSSVESERAGSNGGAARLKLKSYQEMSLVDIDPDALKGKVISRATLALRTVPGTTLRRITAGSCSSPWIEGMATGYAVQDGVSTFNNRLHPDTPWSFPGSDFCSVVLGEGNSIWRSSDASDADAEGWQRIEVDPAVLAYRVAGLSYGFLIFDDTGSEWKRDGDAFTPFPFPNRYVYSREQGPKHAPYFEVELRGDDPLAPEPPSQLQSTAGDLPPGEAWISWLTPADRGPAGTLGFEVKIDEQTLPRYLIPPAGAPGQRVRMHLRDLSLADKQHAAIAIAAVDAAGNVGQPLIGTIALSTAQPTWKLPELMPLAAANSRALVKLGEADVAVIDELDKVHPITGQMIPEQPPGYWSSNHLWNAEKRLIMLAGARKECVAFQVVIGAPVRDVRATLELEGQAAGARVQLGAYRYVATERGPLPDPIVPLTGGFSVPSPSENISGQRYGSLHVELEIPEAMPAGVVRGHLRLRSADAECELPIELQVWDFALPDRLSFLPEMNCYGLPSNERDYYRLAHQHRTVLNRLPYAHRGTVDDGCAPLWNGDDFDWEAWDKRFGPLFDGTAFDDLPRRGTPIECFYLPLFENWPVPIEPHYNGDYWADRGLSAEYRAQFVLASQRIAEHLRERGWDRTLFHFYLNGKNDYKRRGWSRATSPWLLDEPAHFQDFWALKWFGQAFHEGIDRVAGPKSLVFRADISRPQWQRDTLDGLLGVNVVGSAFRKYRRQVLDRRAGFGETVVEYGTSNRPDQSNIQPAAWCVDAWALGIDGVLPWQTIGNDQSWKQGDELSLFYPPRGDQPGPVPSVRLKAYRRGQQDVEYLSLATERLGLPRWEVGQQVRQALGLDGTSARGARESTGNRGNEDAGRIAYGELRPQELDALRKAIAQRMPPNASR